MTMEHVRTVYGIERDEQGRHRIIVTYLEDDRRVDIGTSFGYVVGQHQLGLPTKHHINWWHENIAIACLTDIIDVKPEETNLLRGKGDVERRGDVPPLVLVEGGWQIWRILEPQAMYGRPLTSFGESVHDRRYKEKCVVNGSIDNALKILHELERAR